MLKKIISNKTWMKIHLYVSLFFIPMALIYAITGSLYIFDIRQNAGAAINEIHIDIPVVKGGEKDVILNVLQDHNLKIPDNTEVKFSKGAHSMGNLKYQVILSTNKNGGHTIKTIDRNLYGVLLLLHKSAGKYYFDILAVAFSIALILLYISGLFITAFCKKDRVGAIVATVLGFIITSLAVYYSI